MRDALCALSPHRVPVPWWLGVSICAIDCEALDSDKPAGARRTQAKPEAVPKQVCSSKAA